MSEPVTADFNDVFDDWIGGATISKRSVVIYGKPGLYAEYEQVEHELEIALAVAKGGEEMGGSDVSRLRARQSEIYDEWMASKSTWVVRALLPTETAEVQATLGEKPTDAEAASEYLDTLNFELLARAVVSVEFADGRRVEAQVDESGNHVAPALPIERLRELRRKLGDIQLVKLLHASTIAQAQEPVIPAPFWPTNSEDGETSS